MPYNVRRTITNIAQVHPTAEEICLFNPIWRTNQVTDSMSLLGLVPDYSSDSNSSSQSDHEENNLGEARKDSGDSKYANNKPNEQQNLQIPLPLPTLDLTEGSSSGTKDLNQRTYQTSSVFFNPFLAEEKKKLSVLEKHVQLSESKTEEDNKRKKQICFKFQKGRCRLGDKCKFSHGLATDVPSSEPEKPKELNIAPSFSNTAAGYEPDEDEESWEPQKKKKRKAGVTDSLIPPKLAMAAYKKQRLNDKPWSRS